jgi:hypothetical protein
MKVVVSFLAVVIAVVPALAAVDVSADTVVRPGYYAFWWDRNWPTVRARCRSTDSAVMSAWFTMFDKHDSLRYRDSLTCIVLAPGEDTTLEFTSYLFGEDSGLWTAMCSVAAPGDTCPANDVVTKRFMVEPRM